MFLRVQKLQLLGGQEYDIPGLLDSLRSRGDPPCVMALEIYWKFYLTDISCSLQVVFNLCAEMFNSIGPITIEAR